MTDPDVLVGFGTDWTGRVAGLADALVRPADAAQVADVVRSCLTTRTPIHTIGGNTGLAAGAVPAAGSIQLSTARLDTLAVEHTSVVAGAGVSLASVQAAAVGAGLEYRIDLGARDTATIGGTIATNAGGVHVIRHGMTRRQVIGIEAVLGTGEVIEDLAGLAKDNTGYHLSSLLCGSEGTLAVVTRARLALGRPARDRVVAWLGLATTDAAVTAATSLGADDRVIAVEFMRGDGLRLVAEHLGSTPPTDAPIVLLVEVAGADTTDAAGAVLTSAVDAATTADALVATDHPGRARLWAWRHGHTEALAALGPVHKLDVSLPETTMATFLDRVDATVAAVRPAASTWVFGHLADGNVHVNMSGLDPEDDAPDGAVLELVLDLGGSISAEHGIGRLKRPWLARQRSAAELSLYRRIKAAFDPAGILNPGILLPDEV